ncbi:MAG: hypothetical protein IPH18_06065 [Chitinophagaceae bacterium]|nr:hypothetical protein [Chitinophagaceae bacterium]
MKLPAYCDSFTQKKGTITPDSLKGDFFDYSAYTYSTTNKNNFPKLTVSFKHHLIDDASTDITFDNTSCLEFLSNNRNLSWFLTDYSIERNCLYKQRYFASEISGVQDETENGINVRAYTGIGRRF